MNRFDRILDQPPSKPKAKPRGPIPQEGDRFKIGKQVYVFAYIGGTGKAILHEDGECNMQDSIAVDLTELTDPC